MAEPTPTESDAVRENRHQLYRKVETIEFKMGEVHLALVGNPSLGNIGLVKRMEHLESFMQEDAVRRSELQPITKKVEEINNVVEGHDRKLWFGLTMISAVWAAVVAFKEQIFSR